MDRVEQIVLAALDRFGLEWLRVHVCPQRHVDKAIGIVMGGRCDATEASVREGLASYLGEMRTLCEPTLLAAPIKPDASL